MIAEVVTVTTRAYAGAKTSHIALPHGAADAGEYVNNGSGLAPTQIFATSWWHLPTRTTMDALPRSARLGTDRPEIDDDHLLEDADAPRLGLTVRLDRPFHELKEYLLAEFERAYVTRCLNESEMNVSMASRSSGLSRKHLRTLMYKYGIRRGETVSNDEELPEEPAQES